MSFRALCQGRHCSCPMPHLIFNVFHNLCFKFKRSLPDFSYAAFHLPVARREGMGLNSKGAGIKGCTITSDKLQYGSTL